MNEPVHKDLLILTYSCPLDWDEMEGTMAIKHCRQCSLNVHNISRLSKMDVEEVFDRARNGEKVCIRSEFLDGGNASHRQTPKSVRVAFTVLLPIAAWLFGWLKTPASAASPGDVSEKVHPRNVFAIDEVPITPSRLINSRIGEQGGATQSGRLTQLGNVDRFGFFVSSNPVSSRLKEESNSISLDAHIAMLRSGMISRSMRSDPFQAERERILARIDRDRVIATDEVIALSNMYRRKGLQESADKTLALAVLLLDVKKAHYVRGGSQERREVHGMPYSETKSLDLHNYKSLLAFSDKQWVQKNYSNSALYLRSALLLSLDNPLLTPAVKKTNIDGRVEKLTPFLTPNELRQLKEGVDLAKGRLDDLSELKAGNG